MPDETKQNQDPGGAKQVPLAELLKERQKRQQAEQQLQELHTKLKTHEQGGGDPDLDGEAALELTDGELEELFVDPAKGKAVMAKVRRALAGVAGEARKLRQERDHERASETFARLIGKFEIYQDTKLGDLAQLKLRERLATLGPEDDVEAAVAAVAQEVSRRFADSDAGERQTPPQPPPSGAGGAAGHLDLDKPPASAGDRLSWARAKTGQLLKTLKRS